MSRRRILTNKPLLILIVVLVSASAYLGALQDGFVYDDIAQVLDNYWIRDMGNIPRMFVSGAWGFHGGQSNYYRPVMHVIYTLNYHVFGLRPWGFHLVNVAFHACSSVLLLLIAWGLLRERLSCRETACGTGSLSAALLFALHPIHTEVVTWIAGVPDAALAFFYLLSFHLYVRSTARDNGSPEISYRLSVLSYLLAALSKEPGITLPALLMAYDRYVRKEEVFSRASMRRYRPYLLVAGLYLSARYFALGGITPNPIHGNLGAYKCIVNAFVLFARYIGKSLFPVALNNFYVFRPIGSIIAPEALLSLLITAGFIGAAYLAYKKQRLAFLGLILFVLPLLPSLYIPALAKNVFTERYLYLPSAGLCIAASVFAARAAESGRTTSFLAVLLAVAALFFAGTASRSLAWRSNYSLWTDSLRKSPESAVASDAVGVALSDMGLVDKAIGYHLAAVRLDVKYAEARCNLANAYNKKGMVDKAIEQYNVAVKLSPDEAIFHNDLGVAYGKKRLFAPASTEFNKALSLYPYYADAHNNLGLVYEMTGRCDMAAEEFRTAVRLKPENKVYRRNLARIEGTAGPGH